MKARIAGGLVVAACVAMIGYTSAEDVKSGKKGGAFDVKAITGGQKGNTLCYVWKYNGERRSAVVVVFSQKVDDNLAKLIKAIDELQKSNDKLGTVMVGVSGVAAADLEKLQETHKLTTPLTIAQDKDGPKAWGINKQAAVTVVVYVGTGGKVKAAPVAFGFSDTSSAAAKASDIVAATKKALGS